MPEVSSAYAKWEDDARRWMAAFGYWQGTKLRTTVAEQGATK